MSAESQFIGNTQRFNSAEIFCLTLKTLIYRTKQSVRELKKSLKELCSPKIRSDISTRA